MKEKFFELLLIDDDELIIQAIGLAIPSSWRIHGVKTLREAPKKHFDAAFVDLHLQSHDKSADGIQVIEQLASMHPHLEIVAISGDLDRVHMEQCLKHGATRFLAKPLSTEEIQMTLQKIEDFLLLKSAQQRHKSSSTWFGKSTQAIQLQKRIAELKSESGPILLEGESGTGKEIAAQLLRQSENSPFIVVNVAAITETLFESEFFGHTKGSFTGADQNKMGLAEAAHDGDLFLDEIEALPSSSQVKLLRFLENGEIRRIGSKDPLHVRVRVIVATNQNLEKLVREGKFREDLLWRLNGKKIHLPPLREQKEDIEDLFNYFLKLQRPQKNKFISEDAISLIQEYHWPGNIRELKRVCEQVCISSPLPMIRAEDLKPILQPSTPHLANSSMDLSKGLNALVIDFERQSIQLALNKTNDIDEAAKLLQLSRSTLYKKIKDYNIEHKG